MACFVGYRGATTCAVVGLLFLGLTSFTGCDHDPGDGPGGGHPGMAGRGPGGAGGRAMGSGGATGGGAGGRAGQAGGAGGRVGPGGGDGGGQGGGGRGGMAGSPFTGTGGVAGSPFAGTGGVAGAGGKGLAGGAAGGSAGRGGAGGGVAGAGGAAVGGGGAAGGAAGGGGGGAAGCGPCSPPANGAAMCVAGACQVTCDLGYHKNGATCDPNNTVACCGPGCAMCPTRSNATSSCDGTQCNYTCQSGFDACDGNRGDANGCEVNLNQDVNHCGTCAKVCPAAANATPVCNAAACGITCKPLFGNCNGSTTDGCEMNLTTSQINCGRCHPKAATVIANDLSNETDYNAHAGPPACREWLGEQCTPTGTSTVALCQ